MFKIYCIEDCNGLKYIGRTGHKKGIKNRLYNHRADKKINKGCSSSLLDLDNCHIKVIDVCDTKEESIELEWFYINSIDCVNYQLGNYDKREYKKQYDELNKEKHKLYREKNKEKKREYDRNRRKKII